MSTHHHPHHRFDPTKAQKLLDPKWRLIDDPLELVLKMGMKPDQHVVDLGCGPGFFTKVILKAVGQGGHVAAVDLQEPILHYFDKHVGKHPNLEVIQADLSNTGLESDQWDVVFIAFTLHEVIVAEALQEIARLLKPTGHLIALEWGNTEPCPERDAGGHVGPPQDHRLLPPTLSHQLEEAGFKINQYEDRLGGCQYWIVAQRSIPTTSHMPF